jgi:hypothetical protein
MRRGERCTHKSGKLLDKTKLWASRWKITVAALCLLVAMSAYAFQEDKPSGGSSTDQHQSEGFDMQKYGPLFTELSLLLDKFHQEVQLPPLRTQSHLLSMLPASTNIYAAFPNYGEALGQADEIFHQQLEQRPVLNEYWQQVGMAGFFAESAIDKTHKFFQYLGDEIIVSATITERNPSFLLVAEVKKPGLRVFLQDLLSQFGGANAPVRILTPQEILTAKASDKQGFVLVRPDVVVFSKDLATLKKFNTQLNGGTKPFAGTGFGQRLSQSYKDGAGILVGADLQPLLALRPKNNEQSETALQRSGFANAKFAILEYKKLPGQSLNNMELSFNGPRQGIASWLAAPGPIGALDFFSTSAAYAAGELIKSPAQIFDDIKSMAEAGNPNADSELAKTESEFKINFRDDLLSKLLGEASFGLDGETSSPSHLPWKLVFKVSDPAGLQQTITKLLEGIRAKGGEEKYTTVTQHSEKGLTYYTLGFGSGKKHEEFDYTFADGYLVAADNKALMQQAIQTHHSGNSLSKSSQLHNLLPGNHADCSAVSYVEPIKALRSFMGFMATKDPQAKQQAEMFEHLSGEGQPVVACAYGDPAAIRVSSNNGGMLIAGALITSAIAIPNLMRSRMAANEAEAASVIRSLNTAEVKYSIGHAESGYASNFLALKEDFALCGDNDSPCIKDGYRYEIFAACNKGICEDYVVSATPVDSKAGRKSFCSTADAVVRSHMGSEAPSSVEECSKWEPL